MPKPPNILFLIADQMQAQVLDPNHPCRTPNIDRLAARGLRFTRAYTPNAVCSPARASLMTGLLPHNHGVLWVTHNVADDQGLLRTDRPHWAQRLAAAGYRSGYFGKWHVERSEDPTRFGWQTYRQAGPPKTRPKPPDQMPQEPDPSAFVLSRTYPPRPGYPSRLHYGVVGEGPMDRPLGKTTRLALDFLEEAARSEQPWCCMLSVQDPHDPFICSEATFRQYDVSSLEDPPNAQDRFEDKPTLYRRSLEAIGKLPRTHRQEAMACYYANVTEVDAMWGLVLEKLATLGLEKDTLVVVTSDHGELMGAHGLYCKNISAFEEIYNIPLVMAGPGVASGVVTKARVGLHDLGPTLLETVGAEPLPDTDARSFAELLADPAPREASYDSGYAEFHGARFLLTQRVLWKGDWKLVFNGFDDDELYNLAEDPRELRNLARDPAHAAKVAELMEAVWERILSTGDATLANTSYAPLRIAPVGPLKAKRAGAAQAAT